MGVVFLANGREVQIARCYCTNFLCQALLDIEMIFNDSGIAESPSCPLCGGATQYDRIDFSVYHRAPKGEFLIRHDGEVVFRPTEDEKTATACLNAVLPRANKIYKWATGLDGLLPDKMPADKVVVGRTCESAFADYYRTVHCPFLKDHIIL